MIRLSMLACAALSLVALATSPAQAQFGRGFRMPPVVQSMFLLRTEAVQKELDLDKDQVATITALANQMQSEAIEIISGLQDLTEEERKEEMPNLIKMIDEKGKELQTKVDKILNPKQQGRLKELSFQQRNLGALQDDEVIAALKLTDDQKKQIGAIQDEMEKEQEELRKEFLSGGRGGGGGAGGDRSQLRAKAEELQKKIGAKTLAVLTPEQRDAFEKMKGQKFEFPRGGRGFGF